MPKKTGSDPHERVNIKVSGADAKAVKEVVKSIEEVIKKRKKELKKDDKLHVKSTKSANKHAEKRGELLDASKAAYAAGDKAKAKELSDKAKKEGEKLEHSKEKGAKKIAKAKNKKLEKNELDLHGLEAAAAVKLVDERYAKLKDKGKFDDLTIITGAGVHSSEGPRVKPAIEKWAKDKKLKTEKINDGSFKIKLK